MRSDAKLGLALGMLVIGFAVAFCFPRPGRQSHIAELRKPTLSVDEPEIEFVQLRSLRDKLTPSAGSAQLNHFAQKIDPVEEVMPPDSTTDVAPQTGLGELLFPEEDSSRPEERKGITLVLPEKTKLERSEPQPTTYRVQAGDTLSGIALKTLGGYNRYLDIFEANRDQLSSPDDLRLGMELRIPSPSSGTTEIAKSKPVETNSPLPSEKVEPESEESRRFRGTQGAPFLSDRRTEVPVHQIQPARVTTHLVQSGDTLEGIAIRYFGTTRAVQQLRKANPEPTRNPQRLRPGVVLKLVP